MPPCRLTAKLSSCMLRATWLPGEMVFRRFIGHTGERKTIAIVGFDDEPQACALGLTSLRPPMQGMAHEAARLLLEHGAGSDGSLQVRLRAQVIPRASPPRRGP